MKKILCALFLSVSSGFAWTECPYARNTGERIVFDVPATASGSFLVKKTVDLRPYKGRAIQIFLRASGKDISQPPQRWLGCKFMLQYTDPKTGKKFYPEGNQPHMGSFEETEYVLYADTVWCDAESAELVLGLQNSTGHVEYDLRSLRVEVAPPAFPRVNEEYQVCYPERVQKAPRGRGVMLPGGDCKEEDFQTLQAWGVNLARYQMVRGWGKHNVDRDLEEYDRWINGRLDHLEQVLLWAKKYGVRIVVDVHTPPGGRAPNGELNFFFEKEYADHFVKLWQRIATRFKGNEAILYGYDLVNEPCQNRPALCGHYELQRRAAEAIRAIDPETTIILEANGWCNPEGFLTLSPLAMDNVIYQVHLYSPHEYTHQGVGINGAPWTPVVWPSQKADGTVWDREYLRKTLEPVRAFERKHKAKIYVGEFSAILWAEGAEIYLGDAIALFEEYGWDWTYHAFREWNGWSVEHESPNPPKIVDSADNPRKRVLLEGFRGIVQKAKE